MNRRRFLLGLGGAAGATVIAGSAVAGWRSHEAGLIFSDGRPFQPWAEFADAPAGDPRSLVAAAILAANPHNTQPWRFVVEPGAITVRPDAERGLGSFDPFLREMWIGLGCAVENMVQAAPAKGFAAGAPAVSLRDAGEIRLPISRAAVAQAPLAAFITTRRTNRAPYLGDAIDPPMLEELKTAAEGFDAELMLFASASAQGQAFSKLTLEGTARINADAEMGRDGHKWFRPHARAIAEHRDGVSIPTAGLDPFITVMGQILPEPDDEASGEYWLNSTRNQLANAPWFGTIAVRELHDRAAQVAAGRLWQKLHLEIARLGLAAQPMNQLPELVDRERQLGRSPDTAAAIQDLAAPGKHVTFAFRLGHPSREVPHSARRPVDAVLA